MAEDVGALNKIIGAVRNVKLSLIDTFGGLDTFMLEAPFMDDELICAEIDRFKDEYKRNADELTQYERLGNTDEYKQRKTELYNRQMMIRAELAYLFSHNADKIDDCLRLLKGMPNDFTVCLEAMMYYTQGSEDLALDKFQAYIRCINGMPDHYLACKMLGELLMNRSRYQYAIPLLRLAAERRPEDIEVHENLAKCYRHEGMDFELGVVSEITRLLTSDYLGRLDSSGSARTQMIEGSWVQ